MLKNCSKNKKLLPLLALIMLTTIFYVGCAKPPTELGNQAQQAVDIAKTEGADLCVNAIDSYRTAVDHLKEANELVDCKDYEGAADYYKEAIKCANIAAAIAKVSKDVGSKANVNDSLVCNRHHH